ncbi:MAG: hypothetical protein U0Q16_15750 [Bryobacteraceae bacterium]
MSTATAAQNEANRANAQKSTGPRTAEGKAVSSRNAVTHGLFSATFAVAPEDRDEFDILLELQRGELCPQGINEELVFSNLVQAAWKIEKTRRLEAQALLEQNEAKLDKYVRYAVQFERAYYRALAELRKLQTERALREAATSQRDGAKPPVADIAALRKQTQPLPDLANDAFCRRLDSESRWTRAKLCALKAGIPINDSGLPKAA